MNEQTDKTKTLEKNSWHQINFWKEKECDLEWMNCTYTKRQVKPEKKEMKWDEDECRKPTRPD